MSDRKIGLDSIILVRTVTMIICSVFFFVNLAFSENNVKSEKVKEKKVEKSAFSEKEMEKVFSNVDLVKGIFIGLKESINNNSDKSIVKLALYSKSSKKDRQNPFYKLIEKEIISGVKGTQFRLFECMECKTVQILSSEDKIRISNIISTSRMREVSERLGVDGFLVWDMIIYDDNVVVDLEIVKSEDGEILWNDRFTNNSLKKMEAKRLEREKELKKINLDFSIHSGIQGFTYGRQVVENPTDNTLETVAVDSTLVYGMRVLSVSSFSKGFSFGIGAEMIKNTSSKNGVSFSLIPVYPVMLLDIDSLFTDTDQSVIKYYAAIGEVFLFAEKKDMIAVMMKSGLEFRLSKKFYLAAGFIYIPEHEISFTPKQDYSDTLNFGGYAYEAVFGINF